MYRNAWLFLSTSIILCRVDAQTPSWFSNPPDDPDFHHGTALISVKESNYIDKADNLALVQLSKQISIYVKAESQRDVKEKDDIAKSTYRNSSKIVSISEIPGAEKIDSFQDKDIYYVYWRLNKKKHDETIEKNKRIVLRNYQQYKKVKPRDISSKLSYLIPCFESIERSIGVEFEDPDDPVVDLRVEVPKLINEIVSEIELNSDKKTFEGQMNQSLSEPIRVTASYNPNNESYGPQRRSIELKNLPISMEFIDSKSKFISNTSRTDNRGNAKFEIVEIDEKWLSKFFAYLDLNQFRSNLDPFPSFQSYIEKVGRTKTLQFQLEATEFVKEMVAVLVFNHENYFDKNIFKKIDTRFRNTAQKNFTSYQFKQVMTIQKLLDEFEKQGKNICTDFQCQIDIGTELQVEKLIMIEVIKDSAGIDITVNMMQTNISERDTEYSWDKTIEIPYGISRNDSEIANFLNDQSDKLVSHFWKIINPGILKLEMEVTNVTADIVKINPGDFDDKSITTRLDKSAEQKLIAGDYKVTLRRAGFETKTFQASIGKSKTFIPNTLQTELTPKTADKAFKKSLIFPGAGQRYTAEAGYKRRSIIGWGFTSAVLALGAVTVSSWSDFSNKKKDYEDAYDTYIAQKLIDDVNRHREIAEKKNKEMFKAQLTALISAGLLTATWIGNAYEAKINFPLYGVPLSSSSNLNFKLGYSSGYLTPHVDFSWSGK
jgi:hypothetical protein